MSQDGRYLNATYTQPSNPSASNPTRGVLKLDNTPDIWKLDSTLEDWMIDGSMLLSSNSNKYLSHEESSSSSNGSPINLFTVRSQSNADETTLIDPSVTIEERFIETNTLEDGKEYIIAVTKESGSVYAVKNISGTSTGNTGSATLDVESGSDHDYIVTTDSTVVWKYSSSNKYLSTSNSHYLGYESSTYLPRVSSQGRAITYSNNKLQIGSGYYLTCDGGTFATSTSSSSGSNVRLFVKTIEIVTCEHDWGTDPVWNWTGIGTRAEVAATATFTCSKCGETKTIDAIVDGPDANGTYIATVTGPDNKVYTDRKVTGNYYVKVYSDTQYAYAGQQVEFKIALGPVNQLGTMEIQLQIPGNWVYDKDSLELTVDAEDIGFRVLEVALDKDLMMISGNSYGADAVIDQEVVIAKFTCTVNATGTVTFNVNGRWEFWSIDNNADITEFYHPEPFEVTCNPLTISYNANGGDGDMDDQTVYQGVETNLTVNSFTRTGYTFAGWATSANGDIAYNGVGPVTFAEGATLYAKWTINKYKVTFVDHDGTVLKAAAEYDYGTAWADVAKPADPVRDGYEFAGWTGYTDTVTGDLTVKATYTVTTAAISYVMSNTVTLTGKLSYKAYVVIADEVLEDETAFMRVTYTDAPSPKTAHEKSEDILIKNAATNTNSDGVVRRVFTIKFVVSQLNDEVKFELFTKKNGTEEKLPLGRLVDTEIVDMTETGVIDTPWEYLDRLIANPKFEDTLKDLARKTQLYGTAAQLQFRYRTEQLSEEAKTALNEAVADDSIVAGLAEYVEQTSGTKPEQMGISKITKSLVVEEDHSLKYYFYLDGSVDISKYTFEIDNVQVTAEKEEEGKYSIQKKNIASAELGTKFGYSEFKVTCGTQSYVIKTCGLVYANTMANNPKSPATLVTMEKAMYLYCKAAEAYFN